MLPDPFSTPNEYREWQFGQLKNWKTWKNQWKRIEYHARGREKSHAWDGNAAPGITRIWDTANRLTRIENSVSRIDYTYDDAAQVQTETSTIVGAGGFGATKYYRYPDGMAAHIGYPGGVWVRHDYTARGQLKTVYDNTGGSWKMRVNYWYLPDGKVDYQDYRPGTRTDFGYDGRGFTNLVRTSKLSGQELTKRDYYRDYRDRIIAFQKGSGNAANPMEDGRGDHYWYDAEGQLTDAYYGAIDPVTNPHSPKRIDYFPYDELGNRKGQNLLASRGWMNFTRKDNGLNQYRAWSPYSIINYDDDIAGWGSPTVANGVLMQDGNITAGFNALNQPMYIWSASVGLTNFGFDPPGRCVKRWSDVSPAMYLYYDGWNLIQEGPSAASASRLYIHGARADEIVKQITPSNGWARFFHYDVRGHASLQTDSSGNIVEQYEYDAFGQPYFYDGTGQPMTVNGQPGSPWGNRFLFIGREYLSELKLYDYRDRMYQPELGRFLQPEPKHFAAGDYNLYRIATMIQLTNRIRLAYCPTGLLLWRKVRACG